MADLPLVVVQYELYGHVRRSEHWVLAAVTDIETASARVLNIIGGTDTFQFNAKDVRGMGRSRTYLGGVLVGTVPQNKLPALEQWVRAIPIHRGQPTWDCQNWVIEAIRELRMDNRGIVLKGISEAHIRECLAEEKERAETGESLIHERGFDMVKKNI
ncbi:hypothetical protein DFH08DRAFT_684148 [Mycena albidolilacea]|uniref:Uncharacterized protein n=1 Tax=Mycena albidolilacea TaxID=1033008 RepID=A0AAD7AKI5_9AGAR|nr:hypothetical protein DFH08DRAFT_684148 [Mycena albidolilacea]